MDCQVIRGIPINRNSIIREYVILDNRIAYSYTLIVVEKVNGSSITVKRVAYNIKIRCPD